MIDDVLDRVMELVLELESYDDLLKSLIQSIEDIYEEYQEKKLSYSEYKSKVLTVLKGKEKKYWIDHYKSYMRGLKDEINVLNSQIFRQFYGEVIEPPVTNKLLDEAPGFHAVIDDPGGFRDSKRVDVRDVSSMTPAPVAKSGAKVAIGSSKIKRSIQSVDDLADETGEAALVIVKPGKVTVADHALRPAKGKTVDASIIVKPGKATARDHALRPAKGKTVDAPIIVKPGKVTAADPALRPAKGKTVDAAIKPKAKSNAARPILPEFMTEDDGEYEAEIPKHYVRPKGGKSQIENLEKFTMLGEEDKRPVKKDDDPLPVATLGTVLFKHLWDVNYIRYLLKKFFGIKEKPKEHSELEKLIKSRMASPESNISKYLSDKENLISKEAMYMHSELNLTNTHFLRKPMLYARLSNFLLRRFTSMLLQRFPGFFRGLYDTFRLANIPVLSNTYINVMIFTSILVLLVSIPASIIYFVLNGPILSGISKGLGVSALLSGGVFLFFYLYPGMRVKSRSMNVDTNLPFAINHIAAVANSGVPPTQIFKLVAASEGYGEVSSELKKIVEFVEVFGYDVLTAIKTVSSTSPSKKFKNFLEGIISSVESGGDLSKYLEQKADESMLSYELERQKYMEAVTTASDIYTGIMLAAPLFFIIALSIVSVIGGQLGGVDVNVIIIFATYVIMPVANIFFMMFLQATSQGA